MSSRSRRLAGRERDGHKRRFGALLALLALFAQTLVALLPMPGMAAELSPLDTPALCQMADQDAAPASKPAKAPGHLECPVCQAIQLAGQLVVPSAPPILLPHDPGRRAEIVIDAVSAPRSIVTAHRARAPPPSV